jgi:branched-subunit amino acid transport protein
MSRIWIAIIGSAVGTYAMRASFLVFATRMASVPPWAQRLLRQIPPAALAAIVVPAFFRPEGHLDIWSAELVAGAAAAVVAWKTRNIALTLVVGLGIVMLLDAV